MSDFGKPRGLGRGLSALLGEPVSTRPLEQPAAPPPQPQSQPAWIPPVAPVTPAAPTANVVELKRAQPPAAAPAAPEPPAITPPAMAGQGSADKNVGPRALAIDLIQRNPNQPRRHFGEQELTELSGSIKAHGVLQPILVRPIADGRYEIVAGERRWRAAQRAGLHAIPAVIRELDELEVLEIAIVENVQRTDLNPLEEAQGFQALIERFGRTQQDIADAVGKSRPHIANMLRLLALPEDLQDMVRDGRLTAGHARALLTAPDPRGLAKKTIELGLNVREVEKLAAAAKDARDGVRVSAGAAEKDADTRALETKLSEVLGLAVIITDKNGAGELRIAYRTLEQLDDIARRLSGSSF